MLVLGSVATVAAPAVVDTSMPGWTWSAMQPYIDEDGATIRGYTGGPGSYAVYSFTGTGVDIVAMRGSTVQLDGRRHRIGSMKVSIDGHLKGVKPLSQSMTEYDVTAFTANGLPSGLHVLQIEPDSGWIVVQSLKVYKDEAVDDGPVTSSGTQKPAAAPPGSYAAINGSFEQLDSSGKPAGWSIYGTGYAVDGTQHQDGDRSIRCENPDGPSVHGATLTITMNQQYPAPITVSGWSACYGVDGAADLDYSVYVDVMYRDGTYLYAQNKPFDVGAHDWQKRDLTIWPSKPIQTVNIYALFRHHRGVAWFDSFDVRPAESNSR